MYKYIKLLKIITNDKIGEIMQKVQGDKSGMWGLKQVIVKLF